MPRRALQFAVANRAGEGQRVANVADAGEVHNHPLKAQAEAGMTVGAVLAEVEVEAVVLLLEPQLPDAGQEGVVVVLAL